MCAVTRLNRDQVVEILRLISCENLVCDRNEFIFDTFIYSEPVKRSKNRSDVTRFCIHMTITHVQLSYVLKSYLLNYFFIYLFTTNYTCHTKIIH